MSYRTTTAIARSGFWLSTKDGPKRGYYSPVTYQLSPFNRALRVMSYYENTNNIGHWAYKMAQSIANTLLRKILL